MIVSLTLCAVVSAVTPHTKVGTLTAASPHATIARMQAAYVAAPGITLRTGDRLRTTPRGSAGLHLDPGIVIDLAGHCEIAFRSAGPTVIDGSLATGELRAVVGDGAHLHLHAGRVVIEARQSIVRVFVHKGGTRVAVERGSVLLRCPGEDEFALQAGDEAAWNVHRRSVSFSAVTGDWSIDSEYAALASVAETSRYRKQITVAAFQEGGEDDASEGCGSSEGSGGERPPERIQRPRGDEQPDDERFDTEQDPLDSRGIDVETGSQEPTRTATSESTRSFGSSLSLTIGSSFGSSFASTSGGLFADAMQQSEKASFPGNIHLITAEARHLLNDVVLLPSDGFPTTREYWSIGTGAPPLSQVTTDVQTGTDAVPTTVPIPGFDAYLIRLDQFTIPDPVDPAALDNTLGITGLLGANPLSPAVTSGNATPFLDERGVFNPNATFAFGEFALEQVSGKAQLAVRRSDQDRQIIKDQFFNDDNDQITPNPDVVAFDDVPDPVFFPAQPTVKVPRGGPGGILRTPTVGQLDTLRRAAVTTLLAEELFEFATRTNQTRFVIDGRVIDITGYQRP